jgi:tRNA modification GTPase
MVIAGAPNAGKSSLFNALLGSTRAIVTDVAGTTRDAIEAVADIGSWPVRLVDTAGLRETSDVVERLGIEVSERYLNSADAVLACGETEESLAFTTARVRALTSAPVLMVRTKSDLVATSHQIASTNTGRDCKDIVAHGDYLDDHGADTGTAPRDEIVTESDEYASGRIPGEAVASGSLLPYGDQLVQHDTRSATAPGACIAVSAATGAGLGALTDAMTRLLTERHGHHGREAGAAKGTDPSLPLLTRERHRIAVQRARDEVAGFERAWRELSLPATVAAVHLHAAATALESLIGGVDVEDVLDRIFRDFCVGK